MAKTPSAMALMRPTISALEKLGGSGNINEIFDEIIHQNNYPKAIIDEPMPNDRRSRLEYNAFWARTHLRYIGALEKLGNGVWSLTTLRRTLSDSEMLNLHKQFRDKKNKKAKLRRATENPIPKNIESRASTEDIPEVEDDWKNKLLERVKELTPEEFEGLSQRLLRVAGFIDVDVTGGPNDGGIDGSGILRMNLVSFRVLFQCKRYDKSVGSTEVRNFRGAMQGRADRGLVITTGTFTPAAKTEATRDGVPMIDLIDGDDLCNLLKEHKLGVKTEMVESISVDEDWFEKNF